MSELALPKQFSVVPERGSPEARVLINFDAPPVSSSTAERLTVLGNNCEITGRIFCSGVGKIATIPQVYLIWEQTGLDAGTMATRMSALASRLTDNPLAPIFLKESQIEVSASEFGPGEVVALKAGQDGLGLTFRFVLGFDNFEHSPGSSQRTIHLYAVAELDDAFALSSRLVLDVCSPERCREPFGELTAPRSGPMCSDFLEISGWAFAANDFLQRAEVLLGEEVIGEAAMGIASKDLPACFAGNILSRELLGQAKFSLTLCRATLEQQYPMALARPVLFRLRCRFGSGRELMLTAPLITWREARLAEPCVAQLESRRFAENGMIELRGWAFSARAEKLKLILRGFARDLELGGERSAGRVEWLSDHEIDARYPYLTPIAGSRFVATFRPAELSRLPGVARFVAVCSDSICSRGSQVAVSTRWQDFDLRRMCEELCGPRSLLERVARCAADIVSVFGARRGTLRDFFVGREKQQTPKQAQLKRVLFVAHNLSATEGAPKVLYQLIKEVLKKDTEVLVLAGAGGELQSQLEALAVPVCVFPQLHVAALNWESYCADFALALAQAREFAPDLVYVNVSTAFWGVEIASRLEVPSMWMIHESVSPLRWSQELGAEYRLRFLHALQTSQRLVFVAKATQELYRRVVPEAKCCHIANGIDVAAIEDFKSRVSREQARAGLGIAQDEQVIAIIGTTCERKGQDVFVREMSILAERWPQRKFRFIIVGARELPFLDELRLAIAKSPARARFTLVPETPDVWPYFRAADLLCICSREESSPLVSLEGFAFELAVVSTRVFGLAEQLSDGENARCFAAEVCGELAEVVAAVLDDEQLRAKLIQGGTKTLCERFALDASLARHWEEMQGVVRGV